MQVTEENFIKYLTINRRLEKSSIKTFVGRFRKINSWLTEEELTLTKQSVNEFLYKKKTIDSLSNSTVNSYINTLNHIGGCYKFYDLPAGFMEGVSSLPKTQPEINPLSLSEINNLLKTPLYYENRNNVDCTDLDRKFLTLTAFIAYTGCRFEEAASLKIKRLDIDNGRAMLVDTKNKRNRYIFFNGPIKKYLQQLISGRSPEDLVFTNSKNNHVHISDFNNNLRKRARKAGISKKVHVHLLRHSFATQFYNATHDIAIVATILGHKDIQTTYNTYVHLDTETLQKAVDNHPLLRGFTEPIEILKNIKEAIDRYKITDDNRFEHSMQINNKELEIRIKIKS